MGGYDMEMLNDMQWNSGRTVRFGDHLQYEFYSTQWRTFNKGPLSNASHSAFGQHFDKLNEDFHDDLSDDFDVELHDLDDLNDDFDDDFPGTRTAHKNEQVGWFANDLMKAQLKRELQLTIKSANFICLKVSIWKWGFSGRAVKGLPRD